MSTFGIAAALGANLLLGAAIVRALGGGWRTDRLAFFGQAWICGCLATALLGFAWLALGRPFDGRALAPLTLVAGGVLLWCLRASPPLADDLPRHRRRALLLWTSVALLLLFVADATSHASLAPILLGDEANIWAAKAKTLFTAPSLGIPFALEATIYPVRHPDYPLLVPLMQVWIHVAAGGIEHTAPRLPFAGVFVALLLILASALRRTTDALPAALLLIAVAGHGVALRSIAYAGGDVAVACGILLTVESYRRWRAHRAFLHGALCAIALAWTASAKNEGVILAGAFVVAVGLAALLARPRERLLPRPSRAWLIALVPLGIVAGQRALDAWWGFQTDLFAVSPYDGSTFGDRVARAPERIGPVARFFGTEVFLRSTTAADGQRVATRLVLLLAALTCLLSPRRVLRPTVLVPALVTAGGLSAYFAAFLISPHDLGWHLVTAAQRVTFHVVPLAALVAGAQLAVSAPHAPAGAASPAPDRGATLPG